VRRACGWQRGEGWWKEVGCGLAAYIAGVPVLFASLFVSLLLAPLVPSPPHHPLMDEITGAGLPGVILIYVLACVWAPLVEETVFRGGFYHYLRGASGPVTSAWVVSLIFATIHPQGLLGVPPLVALAMILAAVREWRGSLAGSMAVHAVHNAIATTAMLLLLQ